MMRSMLLAIAALRNHQVYMDVVSSNISNVNTTGFKGSRVSFQELFNQTIRGASAPQGALGGLNPMQIGLGVALGGVDTLFTQGSLQDTGKLSDLAIQGDGFFVLDGGSGFLYSRDGALDVGLDGTLQSLASGMKVMGWSADADGNIDTAQALGPIQIPFGQSLARPTSTMVLRGNMDAQAAIGTTVNSTVSVYDSLGVLHAVDLTFTKTSANNWSWAASDTDPLVTVTGGGNIVFDDDGTYSTTNPAMTISMTCTNGAANSTVTLDMGNLTQLSGLSNVSAASQDGLPPGSLSTFSVSDSGEIVGVFSNGLNRRLGQIALAKFVNPGGLLKMGQSLYAPSANSGLAQVGLPGQDGRGQVAAGYLEMSNVELAKEFTNMIIAQRGFQANSRVITASDEMLQDLVNLKR